MDYDILMVGHISKDILIDHEGVRQELIGGAVVYSSFAAACSKNKVKVVTKLSLKDSSILEDLQREGIDWEVLGSRASTSIRNTYYTADKERRKVELVSQADPFILGDLETEVASIYHLAGLFAGEIPDSFIEPLSKRGLVALDAQGVLRCLDSEGNLAFNDWDRKRKLLPLVTFFKTDAAEAEILTGFSDRRMAALTLNRWGAKEVMLTHNSEVLVCADKKFFTAPFTNTNNSGRTGRGDTTFAAYLAWRKDHGIEESTSYAAALCSIKMENPGPFKGTSTDVLNRIRNDKNIS
ncbi:PfkB family carbohydrate kinase [uncultured Sphaerochaeta sp.]|uniref:PfkB family carbohydrate kinase n=1 Tax=uncultured Sphaerochaeta sp. TaxID=886478 RepID=UPI002A0A87F6|nr:PfkB family carbohydrate kinase [uncultured Sphaerochaeta sp.]